MELKLKIGIENLKFGMTQDEVIEILGKPDRNFEDDDDDNQIISEWYEKKLRLTFYKSDNNKMGYLRTINENLFFKQEKIIGKKIDLVKDYFKNDITSWENTDYLSFINYFNEKYWLSLHVEFGVIVRLEMGVPFNENNEYDWPQ